jgi:transposase
MSRAAEYRPHRSKRLQERRPPPRAVSYASPLSSPTQVRRAAPRPTKLAPYHPLIQKRLTTYPELSAVRLLAECRAGGYAGGYSQLTAYVARIRPRPALESVIRFEAAPGEQAQFDFAEVKFPWGKRWVLLVVLGYSRLLYASSSPGRPPSPSCSGWSALR